MIDRPHDCNAVLQSTSCYAAFLKITSCLSFVAIENSTHYYQSVRKKETWVCGMKCFARTILNASDLNQLLHLPEIFDSIPTYLLSYNRGGLRATFWKAYGPPAFLCTFNKYLRRPIINPISFDSYALK